MTLTVMNVMRSKSGWASVALLGAWEEMNTLMGWGDALYPRSLLALSFAELIDFND